ncbi:MAG: hypothetical protein WCP65_03505 [Bacteroidota bacterium]
MFSPFKNIEALLGAILGCIIILLFTHHGGIGVSRDSIAYLSAANSFVDGRGFVEYDHVPLALFPVGYPIILGIVKFITHSPVIVFGAYLNAGLFAVVIYLLGCILKQMVFPNSIITITLISILVFAVPLHEEFYMLWSESVFILLEVLLIISLTHYFTLQKKYYYFIAVFIASYAAITRFAGITFIVVPGLLVLLNTNITLWKRWKNIIAGVIVGITPLAINLIRNYYSTTEVAGNRQKGIYTLYDNISFSGKVFCEWFYNTSLTTATTFTVGLIILVLLVVYSIYILFRIYKYRSTTTYYKVATIYGTIYYLFILTIATLSRFETINNRLLSPLFIPVLLLMVHIGERLINSTLFASLQRTKAIIVSMIFVVLLSKEVMASYDFYIDVQDSGIGGYTEDSWRQSETIEYINEHLKQYSDSIPVYSNSAHSLYLFTNTYFHLLPEKTHDKKIAFMYTLPQFYVIWFKEEGNDDILPLATIQQHRKMKLIQHFGDGEVLLIDNE